MRHPFLKIALAGVVLLTTMAACSDLPKMKKLPQPSANIVRKSFPVTDFSKIDGVGIDIVFRQADSTSVIVEAPENYMQFIRVESKDNSLDIIPEYNLRTICSWGVPGSVKLKAYVTSPNLTDLELTGSHLCHVIGLLDTDNLDIEHTGSGTLVIDSLICNALDYEGTGSGAAHLSKVRAGKVDSELTGSGSVELNLIGVKDVNLSLTGSGDYTAFLVGCGKVKAELIGSGNIFLNGTARQFEKDKTGSGSIVNKLRILK